MAPHTKAVNSGAVTDHKTVRLKSKWTGNDIIYLPINFQLSKHSYS